MAQSLQLWSIALVAICSLLVAVENKEVVCYYGTWAVYRSGDGKFTGDNVNPLLCTQLVYAFFDIDSNGGIIDPDPRISTGEYNMLGKFRELKQRHPALKTLVAIGGWSAGTANFSAVARNVQLRATFARNAVTFLRQHGFDGMDIDWEYPAAADRANFVLLLKELANTFAPYKYLLTVAVGAPEAIASTAYDIPAISSIVSYINLMTYEMHGTYSVTRHHAAINQGSIVLDNTKDKRSLNVVAVIKYWLSKGASASKLTLGIPLYGRSYRLASPSVDSVGAPISGNPNQGQFTKATGTLAYYEICSSSPFSRKHFDSVQIGAYASGEGDWVSYDSVESISQKCDVIAKYSLGGGMVWAIDMDDFLGKCGPKFPLLSALNSCVNKNVVTTVKSAASTVAVTSGSGPSVYTIGGYFFLVLFCVPIYIAMLVLTGLPHY